VFGRDPLKDPEPLIRRVYAYVAYRVGDNPDAEDITSETFERALRYRQSYDPSRGEPASWLVGIARRVIAESFSRRVDVLSPEDELNDPNDPEDLEERTILRLSLAGAVASLEERDRELIALRYGADLTASQIGTLMDMRANSVEVALHRALERLRTRLTDNEGSEGQTSVAHLQPEA
jgi:RNA polymerase sigma-70 factor, ECF subfamily